MNPTAEELLEGGKAAIAQEAPPEAGAVFSQSKTGVAHLIMMLAQQEMANGVAVRVAENKAIRALFKEAADWVPALKPRLLALLRTEDADQSIPALDAANADLRNALIELHAATDSNKGRNMRVLRLLRLMAEGRKVDLPGMG